MWTNFRLCISITAKYSKVPTCFLISYWPNFEARRRGVMCLSPRPSNTQYNLFRITHSPHFSCVVFLHHFPSHSPSSIFPHHHFPRFFFLTITSHHLPPFLLSSSKKFSCKLGITDNLHFTGVSISL